MRPWKNHASKGEWGWFLSFLPRRVAIVLGMVPSPPPPPSAVDVAHGCRPRLLDLSRPPLSLACGCLRGSWGLGEKASGQLEASEVQHLTGREGE